MPVPASLASLSQTADSNSPLGNESPTTADNYVRTISSFIAQIRDGKGLSTEVDLASSALCDIGSANSHFVRITGSATITAFGTNFNGPRFLRFAGSLTLTHGSSLVLPGSVNITTSAGDYCVAVPIGNPAVGWQVINYQLSSVSPSGVATGSIHYFPSVNAPVGYVKANGAPLARATYPGLWAFAQTSGNIAATDAAWTSGQFSPGNGTTTFRVPDLRGYHIRSFDDLRGIDTGRAIGSVQSDAVLTHGHSATVTDPGHSHTAVVKAQATVAADNGALVGGTLDDPAGNSGSYSLTTSTATTGIGVSVASAGAAENRVKTIAYLACIKY